MPLLRWPALVAFLAVTVAACRTQGVISSLSQLTVTPLAVDFGEVAPGQRAQQTVTLANAGSADITLSAVAFELTAGAGLSCDGCDVGTLASQETRKITLTFAPTSRRVATATVTIRSTAENTAEAVIRIAGNSRCVPEADAAFCSRLGRNCGTVFAEDNCDIARTVTSCGACAAGTNCGNSNVCGCNGESDQTLCGTQARSCGPLSTADACGAVRTIASCGTCNPSTEACTAAGLCQCVPESDAALCTQAGVACGPLTASDRCGAPRTVSSCGACGTGEGCSSSGQCSCSAPTDAEVCVANGKNCGALTVIDRCGTARAITSCGTCSGTTPSCGGSGTAGVCGCSGETEAEICAATNRSCGAVTQVDRCGVTRTIASCGTCSGTGVTCGGANVVGQCGCTPETNAALCTANALRCGPATVTDRCGMSRAIASCGSCASVTPAFATPSCNAGTCEFTCNAGYKRVGNLCVVSCEGAAQTALPFAGGAGTSNDPYLICTVDQLQSLRGRAAATYDLVADLDLASVTFAPIGTLTTRFYGEFRGRNFTISNWSYSAPTTDYVGLFGFSSADISDLRLVNFQVTGRDSVGALAGHSTGPVRNVAVTGVIVGRDNVGGLAGRLTGSGISLTANVMVTGRNVVGGIVGEFTGNTLDGAVSSGAVSATGNLVGGVAGSANATALMTRSSSSSGVTGVNQVGGFLGKTLARRFGITQCTATGAVNGADEVGGLVGSNDVPVLNSYATGAVAGTSRVGGLIGSTTNFIAHSYSSGSVTGSASVGGLVGTSSTHHLATAHDAYWNTTTSGSTVSALGLGKTTAELGSITPFSKWNTYTIWRIGGGTAPTFRATEQACIAGAGGFAGGSGTPAAPYLIDEPSQLYNVRCNLTASFKLTADLDFTGRPMTPMIGEGFDGTFDGDGRSISNWVSYDAFNAFIRRLGGGATLRNLTLTNVEIGGAISVATAAGSSTGTVSHVSASGTVRGSYVVGGLVAEAYGGVIEYSSSSASVVGDQPIGGLVGTATGTIRDSFASGNVNAGTAPALDVAGFVGSGIGATISNSYSSAVVSTGSGFVGGSSPSTITSSYWDTERSGRATSLYGIGKSTAEMKTQSTFTGWDFGTVWQLLPGQYPTLR